LLEEELDAGESGGAHEVALRRQEPTAHRRSLDHEFLGLTIGLCDPEEVEDAGHRGVVEELVPNRRVAPNALAGAAEPDE